MNIMCQAQFEPMILSGRKPHTVRRKRKKPLRIGQPLSLRVWTGKPYRSKQREFHYSTVKKVVPFHLDYSDVMIVDGVHLSILAQNDFAWHDGFENADEMRKWFLKTHAFPFDGEVIYWRK